MAEKSQVGTDLHKRLVLRQKMLISKLESRIQELEKERDSIVRRSETMVHDFSYRIAEIESERNEAQQKVRRLEQEVVTLSKRK